MYVLLRTVTKVVVFLTPALVREDLVRLVDPNEALLGEVLALAPLLVGVPFPREQPVGLCDGLGVGGRPPEGFVVESQYGVAVELAAELVLGVVIVTPILLGPVFLFFIVGSFTTTTTTSSSCVGTSVGGGNGFIGSSGSIVVSVSASSVSSSVSASSSSVSAGSSSVSAGSSSVRLWHNNSSICIINT